MENNIDCPQFGRFNSLISKIRLVDCIYNPRKSLDHILHNHSRNIQSLKSMPSLGTKRNPTFISNYSEILAKRNQVKRQYFDSQKKPFAYHSINLNAIERLGFKSRYNSKAFLQGNSGWTGAFQNHRIVKSIEGLHTMLGKYQCINIKHYSSSKNSNSLRAYEENKNACSNSETNTTSKKKRVVIMFPKINRPPPECIIDNI
jgi:hypothetical protein